MIAKILRGTTLKMQIFWDYPSNSSVTLDSVDFFIEYWTSSKNKFTVQKNELLREDVETENGTEVNWYLYIDTNEIGNGNLVMRLKAYVPDDDAPNRVKIEYTEYNTEIQVYG